MAAVALRLVGCAMPRLIAVELTPRDGQVAILDATWQDYPHWESSDEWVAFKALSLIHPDHPPYPGFAVATRGDVSRQGPHSVIVEVWCQEAPTGLHEVHRSVLAVGAHGIEVGNEDSGHLTSLDISRGQYDLQVWVDGDKPDRVALVAFVLSALVP